MTIKLLSKRILFCCFFITLLVSTILVQKNLQPSTLLSKNITYYLPGQKNNCLWVIQLDNSVKDYLGSNSEIKIGIPQAQKMGYLAGRIEVGKENTLILAFNPPQAQINKPPIVMTADYSSHKTPIESIRFRWTQSSLVTVILFNDRNTCLASRVRK